LFISPRLYYLFLRFELIFYPPSQKQCSLRFIYYFKNQFAQRWMLKLIAFFWFILVRDCLLDLVNLVFNFFNIIFILVVLKSSFFEIFSASKHSSYVHSFYSQIPSYFFRGIFVAWWDFCVKKRYFWELILISYFLRTSFFCGW